MTECSGDNDRFQDPKALEKFRGATSAIGRVVV